MGLGDIFRQIAGAALPIVGGIFGGPVGAAAGSALGGALQKKKAPPLAMPGGALTMPGFSAKDPWIMQKTSDKFPGGIPPQLREYLGEKGYLPAAGAGASGTWGRRYRRMNPMNVKAARRAIRRIKSTRKLLRSIESQLPRRPCVRKFGRRR